MEHVATFATVTGSATKTGGSTTTHKITTGLSSGTTYYFRVIATKTGYDDSAPSDAVSAAPGGTDYDADNDGLIDVDSLAKLNAIRWDLDGGRGGRQRVRRHQLQRGFPQRRGEHGVRRERRQYRSNDTGNPTCSGYELTANLDFDTNSSGGPNAGDTYWNSGQGWLPIGATAGSTTSTAYTGEFDGRTFTISNLHINRSGATAVGQAGLFAELGSSAEVSNLSLKGVSVTAATNSSATTAADIYAGGIAGKNTGAITGSYVIGTVTATQSDISGNTTEKNAYAGGLVAHNTGSITSSYARVTATAEQKSATASKKRLRGRPGRLPGHGRGDRCELHHRGGDGAERVGDGGQVLRGRAGGLPEGGQREGRLLARPPRGEDHRHRQHRHPERGRADRRPGRGKRHRLLLDGHAGHRRRSSPTERKGGLAGHKHTSATVTDGYWDTTTSGISSTGAGTGKTTSQLQTPHRLRNRRQRHLQGLGHRPRHGAVRHSGSLGLRHQRPVPGPQARPDRERPSAPR